MIRLRFKRSADSIRDECDTGLVAWTVSAILVTTLIALGHPFAQLDDESLGFRLVCFGLVASQSIALTVPGVFIAWLVSFRFQAISKWLAIAWCIAVPTLVAMNSLTWAWIDQPILSGSSLQVLRRSGTLRGYATWSTAGWIVIAVLLPGFLVLLSRVAGKWLTRWLPFERSGSNWMPITLLCVSAIMLSTPAAFVWDRTAAWMRSSPSRNPVCMIQAAASTASLAETDPELRRIIETQEGSDSTTSDTVDSPGGLTEFQSELRRLAVKPSPDTESQASPDILIAIVESMRPELVDEQTMPSVYHYASRGLWCREHFSGGNATTHGFFSLLNGLDASWYESPVRFTPLLNRVFRSQGYELGFFAGDDQWSRFYMDAFIHPDHFDVFDVVARNGLESDRYAITRASRFLDEPREQRAPRVAIVYLYATHATYLSYPKDQIFQPAADDRMLYPYSPSARAEVWNRYRNSARTVDRFLSVVMREDRVVLVTGDHGEAFLEDGTIGHGTKISYVQNRTPAIAWIPGIEPQQIETPTMHADILPTLVDALGWEWTDPQLLSGESLLDNDERSPSRCFVTRDYLSETLGLIGPWTVAPNQPFAWTFTIDQPRTSVDNILAIDEAGEPLSGSYPIPIDRLRQWLRKTSVSR